MDFLGTLCFKNLEQIYSGERLKKSLMALGYNLQFIFDGILLLHETKLNYFLSLVD